MALSIYQNNTKKGEVNDIQTARLIVAQLVAADLAKDVVVKENTNNVVIKYEAE